MPEFETAFRCVQIYQSSLVDRAETLPRAPRIILPIRDDSNRSDNPLEFCPQRVAPSHPNAWHGQAKHLIHRPYLETSRFLHEFRVAPWRARNYPAAPTYRQGNTLLRHAG